MTKTLVIHIGHYKTGTTALQVFCANNAAALARRGLAYPRTGLYHAKHSVFAFSLLKAAGAKTLLYGFANPRTPEDLWSDLLAEVRTSPASATLISSEEFMRLACFPAGIDRLRAILAGAPDITVKVIAYLRPMDSHLRSWHNQLIKLRVCTTGFDSAVRTTMESIHLDYALALRPWAELTDAARYPGRLIVRAYDDSLRIGDRMFDDFLSALGVRMPSCPRLHQGDPNPRLDGRVIDLIRMARAAGLDRPTANQFGEQALAYLDAASQRRAAETPDFSQIRARAEAGLREVAALAGREFPLHKFLTSLPRPSEPHEAEREMLVEFLMQDRAALLARIAALEAQLAVSETATQQPDVAMPPAAKPG
jgi:hypothetical protein